MIVYLRYNTIQREIRCATRSSISQPNQFTRKLPPMLLCPKDFHQNTEDRYKVPNRNSFRTIETRRTQEPSQFNPSQHSFRGIIIREMKLKVVAALNLKSILSRQRLNTIKVLSKASHNLLNMTNLKNLRENLCKEWNREETLLSDTKELGQDLKFTSPVPLNNRMKEIAPKKDSEKKKGSCLIRKDSKQVGRDWKG